MKILFTGGGTIGSVSPLIGVKEKIQAMQLPAEYFWIGTESGIEVDVVKKAGIKYQGIKAGKFRRYFSLRNLIDPILIIIGFFQSIKLISTFKPDVIISAGSFVSVPVVFAGRILKKKIIVHQQDLKVGLANKLMAPLADKITVSFESLLNSFNKKKVVFTGNPYRESILKGSREQALEIFNLEDNLPTVLIMGGSLGAEAMNKLVFDNVTKLIEFCQVIHVTGKGQKVEWEDKDNFEFSNRYHAVEYLFDDLVHAYAISDLIVCRAGLATLTELTVLAKPMIVMPIPNNQQQDNAQYFDQKNMAIVIDQKKTTADSFFSLIKSLITNKSSLQRLNYNLQNTEAKGANDRFIEQTKKLINYEKE